MSAENPATRYNPYPAYKPSGVEWLGKIPEGWETLKLKRVTSIRGRIGFRGYTVSDFVEEGEGALTLGATHINDNNNLNISDPKYISWEKYYESPEIMISKDDLIVVQRGSLGKTAIIDIDLGEATINPSLVLLKQSSISTKSLYYFLTSRYIVSMTDSISSATAVPMISQRQIGNFDIYVPPLPEQTAISDFLDRETAKIDELIAKKERLIELLVEKRTAIINQAVTKGLDPDAKMKPSGVEWLGDIPEYWEVKKGSLIGKLLGSYSVDDSEVSPDGVVKYVKVDDLNSLEEGLFLRETKNYLPKTPINADTSNTELLLFPKRGAAIFTNKVCVSEGPLLFDSNIMAWDIFPSADIRYIAYSLLTRGLSDLADVSSVPQINNKHINPGKFPFPPKEEQGKIVRYVFNESRMIGSLISKVREGTKKLQEYRTALISAAVTGKIDVRNVKEKIPC